MSSTTPALAHRDAVIETALNTTDARSTYAPTVREAQEAVANAAANNYWIDTDELTVNPVDGVHFDASGHLALGEAFADVLIG